MASFLTEQYWFLSTCLVLASLPLVPFYRLVLASLPLDPFYPLVLLTILSTPFLLHAPVYPPDVYVYPPLPRCPYLPLPPTTVPLSTH